MGYEYVPAVSNGIHEAVASVELSARRTGMSFQRTRMSADRTLMSVIRTSLSLIGFGFTLNQVFRNLQEQHVVNSARAPRNFGETLVFLGVGLVATGIAFHVQFMLALRQQREEMTQAGLIHGQSRFPVSYTLILAILLLLLGVAALASFAFGIGPLH